MNKYKKNLLIVSLVSSLLAGCGQNNDDKLDSQNDQDVELIETESETSTLTEAQKGNLIINNFDIDKYGLYDDSMVTLFNVTNPDTQEQQSFVMQQVYKSIFDSTFSSESFMKDAKEASMGYLTDEEIEKSYIIVVINVFKTLDEKTHYSEKRTYFEVPDEDGNSRLVASIDQNFNGDNIGFYIRTFAINENSVSGGVYAEDGVPQYLEIGDERAQNIISRQDLPIGIYRKEDLINLDEKILGLK